MCDYCISETIFSVISTASIMASIKKELTSTTVNDPSLSYLNQFVSVWERHPQNDSDQGHEIVKRHVPQRWHWKHLQLTSPLKLWQVFIKGVWKCSSQRIPSCFTASARPHPLRQFTKLVINLFR